jgi:CheY-like chemotaxis protein
VKLLIVEDNPTQRGLLAGLLAGHGHDVRAAASGPEALAELARRTPDLVVLDLVMPGLDGPGLLREMRDRGLAGVPVVVTTAWPDPLPDLALPVTVLRKPFAVEELEAALAKAAPPECPDGAGGTS